MMKNLIYKILKETEDEFDWVPDLQRVKIVSSGCYYPTNLPVMVTLGVTGAKEFLEKYGESWWNAIPDRFDSNKYNSFRHDEEFLISKIPNLTKPENGDICFITDNYYQQDQQKIYRLVREKDNKEFIMHDGGFKRI